MATPAADDAAPCANEHAHPFFPLLWMFTALAVGLAARTAASVCDAAKVPYRLPYTVVLLLMGFAVGASHVYSDSKCHRTFWQSTEAWVYMNGELILFTFLPALLMGDALTTNLYIFKRSLTQIILLATVGVLVSAALTAVFARYALPYDFSWTQSLVLGSILAATDPVAVIALLKELGAPRALTVVIAGESLLNDGTAAVLFRLFQSMEGESSQQATKPAVIVEFFARACIAGPLIGVAFGVMAAIFLEGSFVYFRDPILVSSTTIVIAYLGFFISEWEAGASGVLAVVASGLTVSTSIENGLGRAKEFVHAVWEEIEYLANTVLFFLAGAVVASRSFDPDGSKGIRPIDYAWALLVYVLVCAIRLVTVLLLFPILRRTGYGATVTEALVVSYGGLRGAVSIALSLVYEEFHEQGSPQERRGATLVCFFVCTTALLTLIINGPTTPALCRALGLVTDPGPAFEALERSVSNYVGIRMASDLKRVSHSVLDSLLGGSVPHEVIAKFAQIKMDETIELSHMALGRAPSVKHREGTAHGGAQYLAVPRGGDAAHSHSAQQSGADAVEREHASHVGVQEGTTLQRCGTKGLAHALAGLEHEAQKAGHAHKTGALYEVISALAVDKMWGSTASKSMRAASNRVRHLREQASMRDTVRKELHARYFQALKQAYMNQNEDGYLVPEATTMLIDAADEALEAGAGDAALFADWRVLARSLPEPSPRPNHRCLHVAWMRFNHILRQHIGSSFDQPIVTAVRCAIAYILAHREATAFLRRTVGSGARRGVTAARREEGRGREAGPLESNRQPREDTPVDPVQEHIEGDDGESVELAGSVEYEMVCVDAPNSGQEAEVAVLVELHKMTEQSAACEAVAMEYLERVRDVCGSAILEGVRVQQLVNLLLHREVAVVEALHHEGVITEEELAKHADTIRTRRRRCKRAFAVGAGAVGWGGVGASSGDGV